MKESGRIKVLHIANTDFFFYYLLLEKLTALKTKGLEVQLLSPPGRYKKLLEERGFIVTYLPISRKINIFHDVLSIIRLTRFIKKNGFQIVHTHTGKGGFVGRLSAWLAGVPVILHTIHGFSFYEGQNWYSYHLAKLSEWVCGMISYRVFFQNREDFQEVKRSRLISPSKARYIGNGVNIQHIMNEGRMGKMRNFREELQLDRSSRVIGFFARLEAIKRHEFFLRAFPAVVKKLPNTVCLIAGEGPLEGRLRSLTQKLKIDRNVRFLGFRDDAKQLITACDLIVLPSYREGIPRILLEAMINEKAVVTTDVKGNREVVDNYRNGILVSPHDYNLFSRIMIDLLKDGIMREKMGKSGRKKVLREFDERRVIIRLLREYTQVISHRLEKSEK
ncbi:MAG: glycosyltransferase family 4 protein [Candidatus Glassbacteria bacterium]